MRFLHALCLKKLCSPVALVRQQIGWRINSGGRKFRARNRAFDYINLDMNFDKSKDINVRIFNNMGQTIFTKKMPNILRGVTALDLSYLKTGVYIVEISDGQIRTNKKSLSRNEAEKAFVSQHQKIISIHAELFF